MTTSIELAAAEIRRVDGNHTLGAGALAEALADAGRLMPVTPAPDTCGTWVVNGLEVNAADKDGEVLIEWEDESDYAYYGTQTRTLRLSRDQVIAILAASNHSEQEQGSA